MSDFGPWERTSDLDHWERWKATEDDRKLHHCSFCGSIHPDEFMDFVKQGFYVGPTDKNYKAYLMAPLDTDEVARLKEQFFARDMATSLREHSLSSGKTLRDLDIELEERWRYEHSMTMTGRQVAKFYYEHLSDAQRADFINFYNAKKMNVSFPGYFYVKPFFCAIAPPQSPCSP